MATVAIVDGVHIRFYWNEHPPPHFHAVLAGETAVIHIGRLEVLHGNLPSGKLKSVLKWAKERQAKLLAAWTATAAKRKPDRIE